MHLKSLRPKDGATLEQLQRLIEGQSWQSAVPASLPDSILLRLCRDFRLVEKSFSAQSPPVGRDNRSFQAALYITLHVLMEHPERDAAVGEIDVATPGMLHALQAYQWGLERETVGRIVGLRTDGATESMLGAL